MRFKKIKKQIKKVNRRLEHYSTMLNSLEIEADKEQCLLIIARLSVRKLELEKELELEKADLRLGLLSFFAYVLGGLGVLAIVIGALLIGGDQEAEYQRNKVANHRIEQTYIVK